MRRYERIKEEEQATLLGVPGLEYSDHTSRGGEWSYILVPGWLAVVRL